VPRAEFISSRQQVSEVPKAEVGRMLSMGTWCSDERTFELKGLARCKRLEIYLVAVVDPVRGISVVIR